MDLDSFLVSLYVLVDDWWQAGPARVPPRRPGRPALLTDPEVITLAILAQWPRFRSERDFWRFAWAHLREYSLPSAPRASSTAGYDPGARVARSAAVPRRGTLRSFGHLPRDGHDPLIPAMVRVRASRKGLFCGQATFGRSASKTEWVYGFKVALVVDPGGVITAFSGWPRPPPTRGP
jgi:hypothetical protein